MAPLYSIELTPVERDQLLHTARRSLQQGLESAKPLQPPLEDIPAGFRMERAVFVTLTRQGKLRGCVGTLEAREPLLLAVAENARGAGFRDPRFAPVRADELDDINIEISVLSAMESLLASSRAELLAALQPERDGLLIEEGRCRATFLPQVWQQLPDPDDFLNHLLTKAGLPIDHWSSELRCFRYQTLSFSEGRAAPSAR